MEIYPKTDITESISKTTGVAAVTTSRMHLTAPSPDRQARTTASTKVFPVHQIGGCLILHDANDCRTNGGCQERL